ncbi:MAG: YfhO family protein, partial [Caldilineaceae bacterium]|nr:YfhO family protein [Caldilineaceae bacterium]
PLQRYNQFMPLFVPADQLVPDGRLREQIRTVPDAKLLGLLNVQYLITDKVRDLWFDGVYYDRQIGAHLNQQHATVQIEIPNRFEATHLDLIGTLEAASTGTNPSQARVAIEVENEEGAPVKLTLVGGESTESTFATAELDNPAATTIGAVVAFRDVEGARQEYRARLALPRPLTPTRIVATYTEGTAPVVLQAATLYDARTQMFTPLLPSDRGRFRLVHSGDVKIYENLAVRPRAYLVNQVRPAANGDDALAQLQNNPAIRQGAAAVVEGLDRDLALGQPPDPQAAATLIAYQPEVVTIRTQSAQSAFLVLSDSAFPGWQATIDGAPTPVYTTNVLFRGVAVPAGEHTVTFRYAPTSWRNGLWLSGIGLCLLFGLLFVGQGKARSARSVSR